MRKCALHSLGCKVNSYETQAMQQLLEEAGYEIVPFGEETADVYIINTCSVTNMADRKSRQMIHKARKLNENAIVVAAGCYVESAGETTDEDIDIVIGNNEKSHLLELLDSYFSGEEEHRLSNIGQEKNFDEMNIYKPSEHTRAYVKIQDGCNRFCTYCIIPYVRGRIRSRKKDDIIAELHRLSASGCKEIVLTGIHLSSYGMEESDCTDRLIDIIEEANATYGIERIRLGSLEPLIVTEEFAKRLSACEKICPHFHLSLQSGCDETLKRMNRRYTADEFENGVNILRKYFDKPAITTDVIVGFPQETEAEFEASKAFLEKIKFYELHVFKYSRRKGTVADKMDGQIEETVKTRRSDALLLMDEKFSMDYRKEYIGKNVTILTEEVVDIGGEKYITGYTDTYVRVVVKLQEGQNIATNMLLNVKIIDIFQKEMVIGVAEN